LEGIWLLGSWHEEEREDARVAPVDALFVAVDAFLALLAAELS
jgi:hypothetical protein